MSYPPQSRGPPPVGNGRVSFVPGPGLATLLCGPPRRQCDRHRPGGRGSPISMDRERASHDTETPPATAAGSAALGELAWLFLRLGATAFGGPAAHIALMEHEVVRRRGWLTQAQFLDLLGATNLIPGPNSTEMAIHVGWHRAGWAGLLVAGACFIAPAALIVLAFAWAYVRFGHLPEAAGLLYGVKPVIIAVVVQALVEARAARPEVEAAGRRRRPVRGRSRPGRPRAGRPLRGRPPRRLPPVGLRRSGGEAVVRRRDGRRRPVRPRPGRHAGGGGGPVRPAAAVPVLPQGRLGPVRQRLRAAGLPAGRPRRALGLADRGRSCSTPSPSARSRRGRCSPPPPSSATCWAACRGRAWPRWGSSCRRSSSWRPAARWCPASAGRRRPGRSSTG